MATIVNIPKDTRNEEIGNSLVDAINQISKARQKKQMETANQVALKSIVGAKDWQGGFDALMENASPETLSDPQQLASFLAVVGAVHRGTQPQTPTDVNEITAHLTSALANIQAANKRSEDAIQGQHEDTQSRIESQEGAPARTTQAKSFGKIIDDVHSAGQSATRIIDTLDTMDQFFEKAKTGPAAAVTNKVVAFAQQFGLSTPELEGLLVGDQAAMAGLQAGSNKLVLENIGGSLGVGFSDADRSLIQGIGPGVLQTEEGNKIVSLIGRQGAQKAKLIDAEVTKMEAAGATLPQITLKVNEMRQESVIDDSTRQQIQNLLNAPGSIPKPTSTAPSAPGPTKSSAPQVDLTGKKPGDTVEINGTIFRIEG